MNSKYYKNVLKKRIGYLVLLVCVIAIGAILSSVSPYIFGKTIDTISIKNQSDFHIWITGYIVVLLMIQLFLTVETLIGQWVTITIENDIKKSLMESILYIKNRYLEQYEKGALLNRIEFDVETIAGYYIDLMGSILMIILNSLIAIYFIFQISIKLSLVAIVFLPFSFLVNYFFRNKIRMIGIKQKEINDQYLSYNGWIFININSLKAFGRQKNILERFSSFLNSKLDIDMKGTKLSLQVSVIRAILSSGLNVALLTIAGILIMDGEMTIGNLVAFNSYLEMLYQAISKMLELNLNKQGVIVSCERLGEIRFAESELKGEKVVY